MNQTAKTALVTGAAKRVGRAIALELAAAGCDVAVHYNRSETQASELVETIRSLGRRSLMVQGDLLDPVVPASIVDRVCTELGALDVLVNNASVYEPDAQDGFDPSQWARVFKVNTFAPAALIDEAAAALSLGAGGQVVNICDICADRPWPGYLAYCASKAALVNVTKATARKLAPDVRVNGVSPGIAVFPDDYSPKRRERLIEQVPLGRAGCPEDIARAVRFLVESGDYITGQIINIDGGRSIA